MRLNGLSVTQADVIHILLGKHTDQFLLQQEVVWVLFVRPPEVVRKDEEERLFFFLKGESVFIFFSPHLKSQFPNERKC